MIDGLEPYPVYKDTAAWLGQVPEHWEVPRLGTLLRERGETNDDNGVTEVLSVMRDRGVIPYAEKGNIGNKKSEDITRYKIVRPDDIVVNCMNVIIGSVGVSKYTGCLSPVYYVLTRRSENDVPHYLNAYFQTKPFQESLVRIGNGILAHRMRIPMELLKSEPFPRPPTAEQSAIVRFLNYADLRIRRYIRAKQKLIKLLEEQKQAIIHRAVTGCLDPGACLRPSGIPWLPETPSHWSWMPIKRLLSRIDYGTSEVSKEGGEIRILTMGNIQKGEVIMPRSGGLDKVPDGLLLQHNDLLFTRTNGNLDLVGKVGLFRGQLAERVSFASYLVRLRVRPPHNPQWLHLLLNSASFWPFARSHALVNLQTNLNSTRYSQFPIPVPPPVEQAQIVRRIGDETKILDGSITRTRREIDLVREYRTRLIADVVTGKLDVREAAAKLPEETHEAEPLDEMEELSQDEAAAEDLEAEAADAA